MDIPGFEFGGFTRLLLALCTTVNRILPPMLAALDSDRTETEMAFNPTLGTQKGEQLSPFEVRSGLGGTGLQEAAAIDE